MDDYNSRIAMKTAAIEDDLINDMLRKEGLEGLDTEELRLLGYEIIHSNEEDYVQKITLYKIVDSESYKINVDIKIV